MWAETSVSRLRAFAAKGELVSFNGGHVRYVPGPLARTMIESGAAAIHNASGRVKAIRLTQSAGTRATMIGKPDGWALFGIRFTRWVRLEDSGSRIIEHHPRSWDYEIT